MMTRCGEVFNLDNKTMNEICSYMHDNIREDVHAKLAPCTNEEFLTEYIKYDRKFIKILDDLFNIEMGD